MIRRPPRSTRTDTLFPYTTLFRSHAVLRRYLVVIALGNFVWEMFHMPLYTIWREGTWNEIAFARSEEHTSELQSLMRISYAVFCLKKKKQIINEKQQQVLEHSSSENAIAYTIHNYTYPE